MIGYLTDWPDPHSSGLNHDFLGKGYGSSAIFRMIAGCKKWKVSIFAIGSLILSAIGTSTSVACPFARASLIRFLAKTEVEDQSAMERQLHLCGQLCTFRDVGGGACNRTSRATYHSHPTFAPRR